MLTIIVIGAALAILVTAMNGAAETAKSPPAPPLPVPEEPKPAPPPPPEPKRLPTATSPRLVREEPAPSPKPTAKPVPPPAPKPPEPPATPVAAPTPMYPVGLTAKLGDVSVGVLKAWLDGQGGAHYEVSIKGTPFGVYDTKSKAVSEVFLRDTIKSQVKAPLAADQVFPVGVEVYRNGQGGKIEAVYQDAGAPGWSYVIKGWDGPVPQAKLLEILRA